MIDQILPRFDQEAGHFQILTTFGKSLYLVPGLNVEQATGRELHVPWRDLIKVENI
jgi:hypothetical protein